MEEGNKNRLKNSFFLFVSFLIFQLIVSFLSNSKREPMTSLFGSESAPIRERPSVRVSQPSGGGRQTFNIFGSGSDTSVPRSEISRIKVTSHISPKKMKV
jgi:hypothetical protein